MSTVSNTEVVAIPEGGESLTSESVFKMMWRTFAENRLALVSLGVLLFVVLFCFVGPLLWHTNQTDAYIATTQNPINSPWFKSWSFPLGTNDQGFDVLGRLMFGGKAALYVGFISGITSTVVGALWGAIAGYRGGLIDAFMMRFVDIGLSIPGLFLLIAIVVVFGRSTLVIILTLGLTSWFGASRLIRGETLSLRAREYVLAVRAMGGTNKRIILRHILPNAIGTMVVLGTFAVADSILGLAGLGFIGLGIEPPETDWGTMLSKGVTWAQLGYWWLILPVGLLIVLVVISLNYIGDALRDAFEVRLQKR